MNWNRTMSAATLVAFLALILAFPAPAPAAISAKSIGERFSCTAGEALAAGALVAIKSADGKCYNADESDSTIRPALGWVVSSYASAATAQVVARGILTGFTALTKGAPVYLSTVGGYTQTAPAYPQVVGYALSATDVRADIQRPLDSSVASTSLKKKMFITTVENLTAGTSIGNNTAAGARVIFVAPTALTISAVKLYGRAAAAGINDSSTCVIKIYNAASTVVTKTFNSTTAWPTAFVPTDLGTVSNAAVASGASVLFDVTTAAGADPPAFDLYLEYTTTD